MLRPFDKLRASSFGGPECELLSINPEEDRRVDRGWANSLVFASMLSRRTLRSVAVGLAVCLLLLSGLAYPQTVAHAGHHAHHTAKTHASVLCSWMCAAGQVFEGTAVVLLSDRSPVAVASVSAVQAPSSAVRSTTPSRGHPSLSI